MMRVCTTAAALLACTVSLLLRVATAHSGANWYAGYNPLPSDGAVIVHGNARFTVLASGLVRMEYQAERKFNDAPTLFALHRATVVPAFNHSVSGSVLTLTTSNMRIEYDASPERGTHGGAEFSPGNLHMHLLVPPYSRWAPFDAPTGNLHGTFRTLDRVFSPVDLTCQPVTHFNVYYSHCEEGLVSRDGWVVVDETVKPRLYADPVYGMFPGSPEPLSLVRPARYIDWYLFGHGQNYKAAMKDFVTLSGPIPLVPRYALGPAFSRWYQWNDMENVGIVQNGFAKHGIPLDVLVIDMDWHYTHPRGIENPFDVEVEGWTGHTTYPCLFPEPAAFIAYLKRRGVFVTFNHHPASGVAFHEDTYVELASKLGWDASSGKTIAYDITNTTWVDTYLKTTIKPIDDLGLQYWWLDYQQTPLTPVPMLNPTILSNLVWWNNPHRYGDKAGERGRDRPYLMGRFGGLGAHRYPIGFVGDTYVKWEVLRFETYFMPTASNVAFQWTHDIGGFEGPSPADFFTRHLQFGTFSPALRTHSSKRSPARAIWTYQQPYFSIMARFYRLRAQLVPYIATAQRLAHETGVQLVRGMYYEFPEAELAYSPQGLHQYFFGDDVWVAPIATPPVPHTYNVSGVPITPWTFWVPPGRWVSWDTYEVYDSPAGTGAFFARNFSLAEVPAFSRPGAIIPMRDLSDAGQSLLGISSKPLEDVSLLVFGHVSVPAGDGESVTFTTRLYDDDGASTDYLTGAFTWTNVTCTWSAPSVSDASRGISVECRISPPEGASYAAAPTHRRYTWRFAGVYMPTSVTLNGDAVMRDTSGAPDVFGDNPSWIPNTHAWAYDGASLSTWIRVGLPQAVHEPLVVKLTFSRSLSSSDARLASGMLRRITRVLECKDAIDNLYGIVYPTDVEPLLNVTAAASRMSAARSPRAAANLLHSVPAYLQHAGALIEAWRVPPSHPVYLQKEQCLALIRDAASTPQPLPVSDERVVAAMAPLFFEYTIGAHLSAPEPVSAGF